MNATKNIVLELGDILLKRLDDPFNVDIKREYRQLLNQAFQSIRVLEPPQPVEVPAK